MKISIDKYGGNLRAIIVDGPEGPIATYRLPVPYRTDWARQGVWVSPADYQILVRAIGDAVIEWRRRQ